MMTRRLALGLLPAIARSSTTPPRVALISATDGPHLRIYVESLGNLTGVQLAAADPSGGIFAATQKAWGAGRGREFRDAGQMLRDFKPHLTVVALESHKAPAAIRAALEASSHVLAEKPACTNADDFRRLAAEAEARKRHLMLAFATRMNPIRIRARQLVADGSIGRVLGVQARYIADQRRLTREEYQRSWFADRDKSGGGHLAWLGIHYIDLIQQLTGQRITEVTAQVANAGGQPLKIEDSAAVTMRLESGVLGSLHSAYYLPSGNEMGISIWGTRGWLRFDPNGDALEWQADEQPVRREPQPKVEPYLLAIQNAVAAASDGKAPFVTTAESLHAINTLYAAYDSARTGRLTPVR